MKGRLAEFRRGGKGETVSEVWAKVLEVIFVGFICCCLFFCHDHGVSFLFFFLMFLFSSWADPMVCFSDRYVKALDVGFVILFQMCYFLE